LRAKIRGFAETTKQNGGILISFHVNSHKFE
jgi:hypothetical protein